MKRCILSIFILFVSCGTAVVVDYDPKTDFSRYGTYEIFPTLSSGLSELDEKRVILSIDSILQQQGYRKSESPELYINFYAQERISASRSSIGIGVGGGGRHGGIGISGGIPIGGNSVDQNFILDIIDARKDNLIWQGMLNQSYPEQATAQEMDVHYQKVLSAILKKFPPRTQ